MSDVQDLDPAKMLANAIKKNMPAIRGVAAKIAEPEKLMRLALLCAEQNPQIYKCTPISICAALAQSAAVGLEPGTVLNLAYIVPYYINNQWVARFQPSAYGLAELAHRSGKIKMIDWSSVYDGDEFYYEKGLDQKLIHVPVGGNEDADRLTHVYAWCEYMSGAKTFVVLSRKQIDRLKNMNQAVKKGKFSPWSDNYASMADAKALKVLCKRLPKSKDLMTAMAYDDAAESGQDPMRIMEQDGPALPEPSTKALGVDAVADKMGVKPDPEQSGDTEPETPGIEAETANTGDSDVGRPEYTGPTVSGDE